MGRLMLLVGTTLLFVGGGLGAIWEFGKDRRNSVVVATSSGDISILQKNKRVQFTVPACHEVVYVKVQVDNELTTPAVTYDKDTHTVLIHYKILQSSLSSYNILAKAVQQKNCGQRKEKRKFRSRGPMESIEDYPSNELDHNWMRHTKKHQAHKNDVVLGYQMLPGIHGVPYYY